MKHIVFAVIAALIFWSISGPVSAYTPQPGDTIDVQILNNWLD